MASELDRFISEARDLRGGFFEKGRPITVARAPGWVDLLGGAAAYGGALALGWPVGGGSFVALQPAPDPVIELRDEAGQGLTLPLGALVHDNGAPREYAEAAAGLAGLPKRARLAAAAWLALMREEFVRFPGGARALIRVADGPGWPIGLLAAIAQALVSAYGVRLAPRELGLSCRVGAARVAGPAYDPGAIGALVSVCAPGGALLQLHQQPAWLWGNLHMPAHTAVWALRVGEGPAADAPLAHTAGAMAYRMAADAEGLPPEAADARWLGYLANLGTAPFEGRLRRLLPDALGGRESLARYGQLLGAAGTEGTARSAIDPEQVYPLRAAAALPVEEHLRARTAAALLRAAASKAQRDEDLTIVGELLARSHWGQRAAGLGDLHGEQLAERVAAAGPAAGLYGARAPAAASGATLVVLGRADAEPALRAIADAYAAERGLPVGLFGGSSSGCSPAGTREI
jgi:hypothetical protein